jgi:hypothetical protein
VAAAGVAVAAGLVLRLRADGAARQRAHSEYEHERGGEDSESQRGVHTVVEVWSMGIL